MTWCKCCQDYIHSDRDGLCPYCDNALSASEPERHIRETGQAFLMTKPAPADRPEPSEALAAFQRVIGENPRGNPPGSLGSLVDDVETVRRALSQPAPAVSMPEILSGPCEHVCWTQDGIPKDRRTQIVVIRYTDYQRLERAIAQPSESPAVPDGDWLWRKLMEWCKRRGVAPADYNDLFAIVNEARAAAPTPTDGDKT